MARDEGLERRLPFSDRAYVEEKKVTEYLLNPGHPVGTSKAQFFIQRGFEPADWVELQRSLLVQPTRRVRTDYGARYTIECNCPTPDGRNPSIRTVWEIGADVRPRLLTAIPLPLNRRAKSRS